MPDMCRDWPLTYRRRFRVLARRAVVGTGVVVALGAGDATRARADPTLSLVGCRSDKDVVGEMEKRLTEVESAIRALPQYAPVAPLVDRLRGLSESRCFRGMATGEPFPTFGSALALKRWWDAGGDGWFLAYANNKPQSRYVRLPPDVRKVLTLDGHEDHPLAPILCHTTDPHCGHETAGWMLRAEEIMRVKDRYVTHPKTFPPDDPPAACRPSAPDTPAARYRFWRGCIENWRGGARYLPPLGPFRAPIRGWLIVRGRRGHYHYCDEIGAYDLETGATFRARRCGDLGIGGPPRDVDAAERRRTGKARVRTERGRVSPEGLREAALLMFLWPEVEQNVARETDAKLPDGLDVVALPAGTKFPREPPPIEGTSGDTALAWDWVDGGRVRASGSMTYPPFIKDAYRYPALLLTIAEEAFAPGCPPAPLPAGLLGRGPPFGGDVSFLDASPGELDQAELDLIRALTDSAAAPCR